MNTWTVKEIARQGARSREHPGGVHRRRCKGAEVNPSQSAIRRRQPSVIRVTNQIRPVGWTSCYRNIKRRSRACRNNVVPLPRSGNKVERATPVRAKGFSVAKRQFIQHAACEYVALVLIRVAVVIG